MSTRPGHTLPAHRRFTLDNGGEEELVVVAVLGDRDQEHRDIARLVSKEGWDWEQLQLLAAQIEAVPDLIEALAACHAQIDSLLRHGPEMSPMVRATFVHCLGLSVAALDRAYGRVPEPPLRPRSVETYECSFCGHDSTAVASCETCEKHACESCLQSDFWGDQLGQCATCEARAEEEAPR